MAVIYCLLYIVFTEYVDTTSNKKCLFCIMSYYFWPLCHVSIFLCLVREESIKGKSFILGVTVLHLYFISKNNPVIQFLYVPEKLYFTILFFTSLHKVFLKKQNIPFFSLNGSLFLLWLSK